MPPIARPSLRPSEEGFLVTVGVSHANRTNDCYEALQALQRAGFRAGATSDEAILAFAQQVELTRQLAENDPE